MMASISACSKGSAPGDSSFTCLTAAAGFFGIQSLSLQNAQKLLRFSSSFLSVFPLGFFVTTGQSQYRLPALLCEAAQFGTCSFSVLPGLLDRKLLTKSTEICAVSKQLLPSQKATNASSVFR